MTVAQGLSPADVAQGQLDAYNAQDLDAFCRFFSDDVVIADLNGAVSGQGAEALRARYAKLFAENPKNHAELLGRMVVGKVVIDHERITRSPDTAPFDAAAIYTIADGKIARVDFLK